MSKVILRTGARIEVRYSFECDPVHVQALCLLAAIQAPKVPKSKEIRLFGVRRLVLTRANLVEAQFAQKNFLIHGPRAIVERVREADVVTELG